MTTTIHFCPGCDLRFLTQAELVDHMRTDHRAHDKPAKPATWGQLVVALDPLADNAVTLDVAMGLARQADMGLALVAVQADGTSATEVDAFLRAQAKIATDAGIEERTWHRLPPGDVPESILSVAADGDATMLCMGAHHRAAMADLLLGSVSEAVVRKAPIPVLLAGPHAKVADEPFSHLLVAMDGSDPSERALEVATGLAPRLGVDLALVQVLSPDLRLPPDVTEDAYLRHMARRLPASRTNWDVVHDTKPDRAILGVAAALPNPIVVVGTHGRTGLSRVVMGSVARDVVRHSLSPVLVVGAAEEAPATA